MQARCQWVLMRCFPPTVTPAVLPQYIAVIDDPGAPGWLRQNLTGTLLHFKFFSDFVERAALEAGRAEHFEGAAQYRCYHEVLANEPALGLWYPGSVRYDNSRQLVELGLIRMPRDYPSGV